LPLAHYPLLIISISYRGYIKRYRTCKNAEEVQKMQEEIMAEIGRDYEDRRKGDGEYFHCHYHYQFQLPYPFLADICIRQLAYTLFFR